jgi:outer membrane protein OmpA-like peptidoglycan-associated protein
MRLPLIFTVLALTAVIFYAAIQTLSPTPAAPVSQSAVAELDIATAQIEANRAEFDEQSAALNKTIDDLTAQSAAQAASLEASDAERSELQSQLEAAVAQLSQLEADNATLVTDKDAVAQELATLTTDIESRETAFRDSEATIQALSEEIEERRSEAEVLEAAVVELESETAALTQQLADREASEVEPQPVADNGALADAEALLAQNAVALAEAEERIALLTEMAAEQGQVTEDLNAEVAGFEAQITTLTSQASALSDEVAKRDTVITGLLASTATPEASQVASCQERSNAALGAAQISFETGTTTFTAEAIPLLEELAGIASECVQEDLMLEIEGHTSNVGGVASNLLLSDGRAKAVRDFLATNGVPTSTMRAVGFGGSEPIADNDTSDGQLQNQRIVFDWEQS